MRGHNICFCPEIRKIFLIYSQYPLLSGALSDDPITDYTLDEQADISLPYLFTAYRIFFHNHNE